MMLADLAGLVVVIVFARAEGSNCIGGYHLVSGNCCKSINCTKNHQFHLCTYDGGYDTCSVCHGREINPDEIDTKQWEEDFKVCHIPNCDCLPGASITNYDQCLKSGEKVCECNRKEWYYGEDPNNCILADATLKSQVMKEGMELLQNRTVRQCLPGYFKPMKNGSICHPHSKCLGGSSVDVPGTSVSDTTCKKFSTPTSLPTTSTSFPSTDSENTEERGSGSGFSVILITVLTVIPSIVGLILVGCCLKLWKRRSTGQNKTVQNVRTIEEDVGSSQTPLMEHQESKDEQNNNPSQAKSRPSNPIEEDAELSDLLQDRLDFESLLSDEQTATTMSSEDAKKSDFNNILVAEGDSFYMHGGCSAISKDQGIGHSEELSKDFTKNATKQPKMDAVAQSPKES